MQSKSASKKMTLMRDQKGLSTVEYAIILALIAVAGIGLWQKFGVTLGEKITNSDNKLKTMDQNSGSTGGT